MRFLTKSNRFQRWSTLILLVLLCFTGTFAQTTPVQIHGIIEKPITKVAMHELFHSPIDNTDLNTAQATITESFLSIKSENMSHENGVLKLAGNNIFTTPTANLPLLNTVTILPSGELELPEIEYYFDNFGNITTAEEAAAIIANASSSFISDCINIVFDDPDGLFAQDEITAIEATCSSFASIICCPGSSPVTIMIQPGNTGVASASPWYNNTQYSPEDGCNSIAVNPFMSSLLGEDQGNVATITINTNFNWYTGSSTSVPSNQVDLQSAVLHEFIHAMGLGSRLNLDGSGLGGVYSPWDLFLEVDGVPVLESVPAPQGSDCCYIYQPNDDLNFPEDLIEASNNGQLTVAGITICNGDESIDSDNDFANMLSHIDEDCDEEEDCEIPATWSDYVFNSGLCFGEARRILDDDELFLLETLGYCTNTGDAPSCYVSLNDDGIFVVTEGQSESISFQTLTANDIIPTDFSQTDLGLDTSCGDVSGIGLLPFGGEVIIQGNIPGTYTFCYQIDGCDGFCDIAEVTVFVRPAALSEDCEPEDCNLMCYGDFEALTPASGFGYQQQLGLENYEFGGLDNSSDIFTESDNQFLHIFNGHIDCAICADESITIPLTQPLLDGCEVVFNFEADCDNTGITTTPEEVELYFFASSAYPCEEPDPLTVNSGGQNICDDNQNLFFSMNNGNGFDIQCDGDNSQVTFNGYQLMWSNDTGSDVNFITIKLFDTGVSGENLRAFLDNIVITSSCDAQITIEDQTPIENAMTCAGATVTLDYEVCLSDEDDSNVTTDVTLEPSFDNAPLGWGTIVTPNFPLTITDLAVGDQNCQTVQVTVQVADNLLPGQTIPIDMNISNYDACNQQDDHVTTVITITDEQPNANFDAMVDCSNESPTVSFVAFQQNIPGVTYNWNFGDGNTSTIPNPTHTYASSGNYNVILTVTNNCGTTTVSQTVDVDCEIINLDCDCPNGGVVLVSATTNQYTIANLVADGTLPSNAFNGCLVLDGTLTINADYLFDNAQLIMEPGAAVIIESGFQLSINQSSLMGCTELWQGITVQNGGAARLSDSVLKDAENALQLLDGSAFSSTGCIYDANHVGIFVPNNDAGNDISLLSDFSGNTFDCTGPLLPNTVFPSDFSFAGMLVNDTELLFGAEGVPFDNFMNTFQNLYNGIISFDSFVAVSGTSFSNMRSNPNQGFLENHGMYFERSMIASAFNTFDNMQFGMRGNASSLTAGLDILQNLTIGIEVSGSPNEFITCNGSNFENYRERGMVIFDSPNSNTYLIESEISNTMLATGFPEAFSAFNSGGRFISVQNNIFNLSENQAGITLTDTERGTIRNNNINFGVADGPVSIGNWSRGISLAASPNCRLNLNDVTAPNLPASGYEVNNSFGTQFCCNTADGTQVGMQFNGLGCDDTSLGISGLVNNNTGLNLNALTIIGGQMHMGNVWCQGSNAFIGSLFLSDASQFIVDASDNNGNCLTLPPNNGLTWFDDSPGTTPVCNEQGTCGGRIIEGRPDPTDPKTIAQAELLAARQQFEGEFSETSNWITGMYLLQKLNQYSTGMLGKDDAIDKFYLEYKSSEMANYLEMRTAIKAIYELDADTEKSLAKLHETMNLNKEVITKIDQQMFQANSASLLKELYFQREEERTVLSNNFKTYRTIFTNSQEEWSDKARQLLGENEELFASHTAAINEKTMNDIILRAIAENTNDFSNNDYKAIQSIALQCPVEGGLAVYTARGWYDYLTPGNQNDYDKIDNCYKNTKGEGIYNSKTTLGNYNSSEVKVYPNPTEGNVTVSFPIVKSEGLITITNVMGELLFQVPISSEINSKEINLSEYKGLLFINIEVDGNSYTEKIIVE